MSVENRLYDRATTTPAWGASLPRLVGVPPGPASRRMAERLAAVESRGVTWLADDFPVFWAEARGANVADVDGNVYVDLTAAFGVAVAGHAHPRIVEAIRVGAGRLVHGMGDVHPPAVKVELLERLSALSPWGASMGILASTGSEAVEIALKTAQLATGREGVIAFRGGYHGLTLGALSVTAREDFRAPFRARLPGGVFFVPFPGGNAGDEKNAADACLAALDRAFTEARDAGTPVGAVIVEPIQGRGGVHVPPSGFLSAVGERAHAEGAVLVFDEIFTGLGRTGSLFACLTEGVAPDLLCLGKALGGGLPLSCCLGPPEVMEAWPASTGEALHTSTFLGHPLSCVAAMALLDVIEEEGLAARARDEGARLRARLEERLGDLAQVAEVRGRGMFIGIELNAGEGAAARVAGTVLREGGLVLPAGARGEVVEITPPLTIDRQLLDWGIEALFGAIAGL